MNKAMKNAATRCIPMYSDTKKGFHAQHIRMSFRTDQNPIERKNGRSGHWLKNIKFIQSDRYSNWSIGLIKIQVLILWCCQSLILKCSVFALDDIVLTECSGSSGSTETQSTKSVSTSNNNSNELIVRSTPSPVQGPGNAPVRAGPPALRPAMKENPKPIRSMQNVQNRPVRTVQVTVSTTSSTRTVYKMEENEGWKPFIRNNVPEALPDQPKPTFFSFRSPPTPVPRTA